MGGVNYGGPGSISTAASRSSAENIRLLIETVCDTANQGAGTEQIMKETDAPAKSITLRNQLAIFYVYVYNNIRQTNAEHIIIECIKG